MLPGAPPIDPGPCQWDLTFDADLESDLVAVGADLEPATLIHAYSIGIFPMHVAFPSHTGVSEEHLGWWSPVERGVLLPGDHHVQRSLRRSARRFEVRVDTCFDDVVGACADPAREGAWINEEIRAAYRRLFDLGWAHSVEVFDRTGQLAGGLYGVQLGGLFAGESMFHRVTDAGKVALWALVDRFFAADESGSASNESSDRLIDVQWQTPHLATQGVRTMSRAQYRRRVALAVGR